MHPMKPNSPEPPVNCVVRLAGPRILLTAALLFFSITRLSAQVTSTEMQKIAEAIPDTAPASPSHPRRVLVFSRAWGYKHTSIPYGAAAIEQMGRKTGAFEATVTYEDALFEEGALDTFDAIVLNNTNNEIFLPENFSDLAPAEQKTALDKDARLKRNFQRFLARGKGLVVIHAGVASFREWPEFGRIMGARFDNHPWNAGTTVTLKVEEPDHPVTRCFGSDAFVVTDEIYQFKGDFSRSRLRVLLSLNTERSDMNRGTAIHRTDGDFGLSWIKPYGAGRVFFCALGHQHDIFWNPAVLNHLLAGLQFALGDLKADATPLHQHVSKR